MMTTDNLTEDQIEVLEDLADLNDSLPLPQPKETTND
jgi:hypothetical protein